jgi:hypothetical protein
MVRTLWPSALVGALCLALLMGSALSHPSTVLWGDPRSEAMGHLWRLEMVMDGLFRYGPLVTASDQVLFPDGLYADFADPINLVFYAPVFWITGSPVLAWNALFFGWVVVAIAGSVALARRVAVDIAWSGPLLVTSTLGAWWLGFDHAARTEYLPALLLPLHLAWLRDALLTDSRRAPWLAGLTLGALALGGWYVALFALIVVVPVALAWTLSQPSPRALRSLAVVAAVSLALVVPALVSFLHSGREVIATQGARVLRPSLEVSVPGVASLFHSFRIPFPRVFFDGQDQPAYPGIVTLAVALAGAFASPRDARRRAVGWLALVAWVLAWAVGFDFVLAGDTGRVTRALPGLPRLLHAVVPVTAAITGWNRIGCMVGVPAGLALVTAIEAPLARWPTLRRAVPLLVVAILLDALTWPRPLELATRTFDPQAPRGLVDVANVLPPGALLILPVDVPSIGEGQRGPPPLRQAYVLWRRELGRAITGGYDPHADSTMGRSRFTFQILAVQDADALGRTPPPVSSELAACLRADAGRLRDLGIAAVVLVRSRPHASVLEPALREWLGVPVAANPDALAWDLARIDGTAPGDCPGVR